MLCLFIADRQPFFFEETKTIEQKHENRIRLFLFHVGEEFPKRVMELFKLLLGMTILHNKNFFKERKKKRKEKKTCICNTVFMHFHIA